MSLSLFRALALPAAAGAAVLSLTGCGSILNGVLGAAESAGAPAEDDVFALEVGDCFVESEMDASFSGEEVTAVPTVDCAEEHDAEVYHTEDLPDGDFPGDAAVQASADSICEAKFEEFVGVPWAESTLLISYLMPNAQGWTMGDQEITCYLLTDGEMVTGTLAGAAR